MEHINGVLFTGGAINLHDDDGNYFLNNSSGYPPFTKTAITIFEKAKKLNDNGIHFPIWGTWMGHQLLMFIVSQDPNFLSKTKSHDTQDKLVFQFKDKAESKLFSDFPIELLNSAEAKNILYWKFIYSKII